MTRIDEIRARLAAACGCSAPCVACASWAARTAPDDRAFLLAEIERLTGAAERVGAVLSDAGCECACSHDYQDHDDDCIRCLGCRVEAALSPEVLR